VSVVKKWYQWRRKKLRRAFSPLSLHPALYLAAGLGVTTDDEGPARWVDLNDSSVFVGQDTTAKKPSSYDTVGHALEFDGLAQYLLGATLPATVAGANTVGIAIQALSDNSGGVGARYVAQVGTPAADGFVIFHDNSSPFRRRITYYNAGAATAAWGNATLNPETWVFRHDGAGGNADFALDGSHQTTQAAAQCAAPLTQTVVGANAAGAALGNDRIWALIVYDFRLSDADTISLSTYLTCRRLGLVPPPGWTPLTPGKPVLWLEQPNLWAGEAIVAWANQGSLGGYFDSAGVTSRPVLLPGGLNNQPAVHFDDLNDILTYSGAAADFKYLHDGSGATHTIVGHSWAAGAFFDTLTTSVAGNVGYVFEYFGTGRERMRVGNGGAAFLIDDISPGGGWPIGTTYCCTHRHGTTESPQYDVRYDNAQVDSGSYTGSPSVANPTGLATVGNRAPGGGSSAIAGIVTDVCSYKKYRSTAEVQALEAYFNEKYDL
jgi:hypothetical protein